VLPVLVVVEEGSLLLQEVVEHCLLHLHQVHLLLELVHVVVALVPVVAVVALELKLDGFVHSLQLVLLSCFQTS
jgi:hypothetical protein